MRRAEGESSHRILRKDTSDANCICRLSSHVEVIWPNVGVPNCAFGARNCGVFQRLNASHRNWNRCRSVIGNSLNRPMSHTFMAGCRSVLRPTLPYLFVTRTNASVLNQRAGSGLSSSGFCPAT